MKDSHLTGLFKGQAVDVKKMLHSGWHDQGSPNFHYGLPRKKNLWVRKITPLQQCEHHPIWLFIHLILDDQGTIKRVDTSVHQIFIDGHYELLDVPFFPHDYEQAKNEIESIYLSQS